MLTEFNGTNALVVTSVWWFNVTPGWAIMAVQPYRRNPSVRLEQSFGISERPELAHLAETAAGCDGGATATEQARVYLMNSARVFFITIVNKRTRTNFHEFLVKFSRNFDLDQIREI